MIVGMDFGTTNSGMAVYDGRHVRAIPLGPQDGPVMDRTALYITNDQSITTGQQAIDLYLAQNVGRPVRMERVRVGTLYVVAAEIAPYYRDVYAERDVFSPGRLFVSFKSFLSSMDYHGTVVGSLYYALEDLVATYLQLARLRAERFLGCSPRAIVLGRPVLFSRDGAADRLAEDRLVAAALRAGYETVYLQYEPVAAALHYEATLREEQRVLVFDFGGGTLDVTVMQVGRPGRRTVLATGGIPVAGDVFDQRIVRSHLARHFGEGTSYRSLHGTLTIPTWVHDALSDWQSIVTLQHPQNLAMLEGMVATADDPHGLRNLLTLAARNYGLRLYGAAEQAKQRLSTAADTAVDLRGEHLTIHEPLTRVEFERLIHDEVRAVEDLLRRVVRDAGLTPDQIDAVVRTGGSSQIPIFTTLLARTFGAARVPAVDAFSSVTSGLAMAAHYIERGELEARAVTSAPQREAARSSAANPWGAPEVTPRFLATWVPTQLDPGRATQPALALTRLAANNRVLVDYLPGDGGAPALDGAPADLLANQAAMCGPDERLLMVTSAYRFLLTTPRRIRLLQQGGLGLPDLEQFAHGEWLCALAVWDDVRAHPRVAVVTNQGFVRLLETAAVGDRLERCIPFSIEKRDESFPVAMLGVAADQDVAVVTSAGRAARVRLSPSSFLGLQAIKRARDERIVGCLALTGATGLLLAGHDGTSRLVPAEALPPPSEAGGRAPSVAPRLAVRAAAAVGPASRLWAVTSTALRPLRLEPAAGGLSRARNAPAGLTLQDGEQVTALIAAAPAAV